jgi:hypothetical protein
MAENGRFHGCCNGSLGFLRTDRIPLHHPGKAAKHNPHGRRSPMRPVDLLLVQKERQKPSVRGIKAVFVVVFNN